MDEDVAEGFAHVEKRFNEQEAMLATLVMGYMEMWVALDTVVKTIMTEKMPEDKEAFLKLLESVRAQTFKDLKEASRSGLEGLNPEVAAALQKLAERDTAS